MGTRHTIKCRLPQQGAALLILLLIILLATTYTFLDRQSLSSATSQRQANSSAALVQAKDALLGFSITYRDSHAGEVFGYMPCPDNHPPGDPLEGTSSTPCGSEDISVIGRLPWKTLGIPPLRDADSECLWYAVAGSAKDLPKTAIYNWDTLGQLIVQDASGATTLAGASAHDRAFAVVLAPRGVLGSQTRPSAGTSECGGSNTLTDYLEGISISGMASTPSTIRLSTSDSLHAGTNNDQGLWITSKDIFDRIKNRSDFKTDVDALLDDVTLCLNARTPATLPDSSAINKGVGDYPTPGPDTDINDVLTLCKPVALQKQKVMINLQDNLLYTKPGAVSSLNGETGCHAMLFFSGTRQGVQSRATTAERATFANYLEGSNLALFPLAGSYSSPPSFSKTSSSNDIARCIKGLPVGATQQSFATDFSSFIVAGPSSGTAVTPDTATQTVAITDSSGIGNGCFWNPSAIPLAGKTLRAYYEFKFFYADTYARGGPDTVDRGNGFTFQMVRSDGLSAPNNCGTESAMGALPLSDVWGSFSYIVQTDVHKDGATTDPVENHTAITINGSLTHAAGTMTTACDGTASGCRHSPANLFEESPATGDHKQRIEIHTGCDAACTACNPSSHLAPNTYARIAVWVDCIDCSDVVADLDRTAQPPTIQRCTIVNTEMNSIYFGLTGGFRSGATAGAPPAQGVTIKNLSLRSD